MREAREIFARLGDYPGARAYVERCDTLLRYQVGNTVEFGSLKGVPIRWRVLDERGKLRLLFAEDIVAERAYNDTPVDTSWRDCTLRKWLNGEFIELFVLNEEEFARYLTNPADRAKGCWWWLRTPGSNLMSAIGVYEDGTAYDFGINVYYKKGGVRPAMWVLLRV